MSRIFNYIRSMYEWFVQTMKEWVFEIAMTMTLAALFYITIMFSILLNTVSYKRSVLVDWEGRSGTLNVVEDGSRAYLQIPVLEDMEKTFQFEGVVYEVEYVRGDRIYLKERKKQ